MNVTCEKIVNRGFNVFLFCSFQAHFFYISNSPALCFWTASSSTSYISTTTCINLAKILNTLSFSELKHIEITVFLNVKLCSLEAFYCFSGTYCFCLQGWRFTQIQNTYKPLNLFELGFAIFSAQMQPFSFLQRLDAFWLCLWLFFEQSLQVNIF